MFDSSTLNAISSVAAREGFDPAELEAVCDVESAGVAFWTVNGKNLPPIRFEGHYFYARLNAQDRATAVAQGLASPTPGAVRNPPSYAGIYDLLSRASVINKDAALESISMGLGQVMGANWRSLGYSSVDDMWSSMGTVDGQVEAMVKFIKFNNLKTFIDNEQWAKFAAAYNGPGYRQNNYDNKLSAAFTRYSNNPPVANTIPVDDVTQMQNMLNTVGGYNLKADGNLGVETKTALRDFQLKHGLVVDGVYGPLSRKALESAYLAVNSKKSTNTGVSTAALGTAGAAITEVTKQIQSINSTSTVLQLVCVVLLVVGLGITLKATLFSKSAT